MQPWSFVHVADMQPGSPQSYRYQPWLTGNWHTAKSQIRALQPELVLAGGDLTRDGNVHRFELEQMKAEHWPDGDATLGFLEYTVDGDRLTRAFVPLARAAPRTGASGPGGHPRPEARDYSLAADPSFARTLDGRVPTLADV